MKVFIKKVEDGGVLSPCSQCYYYLKPKCLEISVKTNCIFEDFHFKQVFPKLVKIVKDKTNSKKNCKKCCFMLGSEDCIKMNGKIKDCHFKHFELIK